MVDPVIDKEGNSFERREIETWLAAHGTSPITRTPMTIRDLTPNRALRDMIEAANGNTPQTPQEPQIRVEIPDVEPEIEITRNNNNAMVSIKFPDIEIRPPVNIVCVIDVSGSMGTMASIPGSESSGLTILDIVKHAVHTIIKSMDAKDKLALVIFSNNAEIALNLTLMDEAGRATALTALNSFRPDSSTNIWAGLLTAMDLLKAGNLEGISSILLFTDGKIFNRGTKYYSAKRSYSNSRTIY